VKYIFVMLFSVVLTGCGSLGGVFGGGTSVTETKMFSNEVDYPKWYTESPKKDDEAIYGVGSEYSNDFQFSVDKAMLSAKRELASNYSSHVSAMMKDYAVESGQLGRSIANADIERTTRLVVARVNLVGVQRSNFIVVRENKGYRTFVRLRFSADESNKIMLSEIQRDAQLYTQLRASKSFRELDGQTDKIEQNKIERIRAMKAD
jgi:hypothetical protein